MLFHSLTFFIFLPIVLVLYFSLRLRGQNLMLLVASYIFYGWWDWRFLSLLAFSTIIDYFCSKWIAATQSERKKWGYLLISLVTNLGCLGFFKYFNFFAQSAERVFNFWGLQPDALTLNVILPVGISFYTFQTLSYTIDVYRGHLKPAGNLLDFALFVSFFPQLVAGPIERADRLLPQIEKARRYDTGQVVDGLFLILLGYVKKVVIADRSASMVDAAFRGVALPFEGAENWLFLYAFAFQIYGDFAGYTDIARGASKLMGFELMRNFRQPYLVSSPSAFWQHWHISLSTWLRDYLYIPLGGNRGGTLKTYRNLLITMCLGGLWHGAGWAYLIWGLYHGLLLIAQRLLAPVSALLNGLFQRTRVSRTLWSAICVVFFFHLTCIGWLIFRVGGLPLEKQTTFLTESLALLFSAPDWGAGIHVLRVVLPIGLLGLWLQRKDDCIEMFQSWSTASQVAWTTIGLVLLTLLGVYSGTQFIYFQF